MNLDLFIQTNNYDSQRERHPTPQSYLNKMIDLFNKHALTKDNINESQWNILDEIIENKKLIQKALLPLKGICNYELNIVGGSLRDIILKQPNLVNDYDFVISCSNTNSKDIFELAKNMGITVDLLDEELIAIRNFRLDSAKEQEIAKDSKLSYDSAKYLFDEADKEFYFSKIINKLMCHTNNYKNFSSNNVKEKYMNFHISSINQFTGVNNKKVDLIVSHYHGTNFLSTFDFELCKIFADLKKTETKEDLLNEIVPLGSMLRDIEDNTFSVKATKFAPENLDYFFNKHLLKLKDKYQNYQVNIFSDKKIEDFTVIEKDRWVYAQYLQMNFNMPNKDLVQRKMKL